MTTAEAQENKTHCESCLEYLKDTDNPAVEAMLEGYAELRNDEDDPATHEEAVDMIDGVVQRAVLALRQAGEQYLREEVNWIEDPDPEYLAEVRQEQEMDELYRAAGGVPGQR